MKGPEDPDPLVPTCDTPMGTAYAPVRLAELACMFGPDGLLTSICRSDWSGALEGMALEIRDRLDHR